MNEQPTNRSQMDLIRRSDVKALFHQGDEKTFPFSSPGLVTERDVDSIPAVDAVEVVRCRECKRWTPINNEESYGWCSLDCKATKKRMHFCGYGQRREDGDA